MTRSPVLLIATALAAAGLAACTPQHNMVFEPGYKVSAADTAPMPLRVGVLLPDAAQLPAVVKSRRCWFGKDTTAADYAEAFRAIAYQTAARSFRTVEVAASKAEAAGRYDALLEFAPPTLTHESTCVFPLVVLVFPLFYPTVDWDHHLGVSARLYDTSGGTLIAEGSVKDERCSDYGNPAFDKSLGTVLAGIAASPRLIAYTQSRHRAAVEGAERAADAARGTPAQSLAHYLDAYDAASDDDPAKVRLLKKVVATARRAAPAIPADAQDHADRGQAFVKLATDAAGFAKAAREFELAAAGAPWWAEAYFNAGLAHEKAGEPRAAAASLKRFLLAAPDSPEAAAVKQKLVELEVSQELKGAPAAEAPAPAAFDRAPAPREERAVKP